MSSPSSKNISLDLFGKSELKRPHLIPKEGRRPSPPNVGMGGGGRPCLTDEWTRAYGEDVWFWRRHAGVKPLREVAQGDGDTAIHREDHVISRKAIAQGMSV